MSRDTTPLPERLAKRVAAMRARAIEIEGAAQKRAAQLRAEANALAEQAMKAAAVIPDGATISAAQVRRQLQRMVRLMYVDRSFNTFICGRGLGGYCNSEQLAAESAERFREAIVTALFEAVAKEPDRG